MRYILTLKANKEVLKFVELAINDTGLGTHVIKGQGLNNDSIIPAKFVNNLKNNTFSYRNDWQTFVEKDKANYSDCLFYMIPWGIDGIFETYLFVTKKKEISDKIAISNDVLRNYEAPDLDDVIWKKIIVNNHNVFSNLAKIIESDFYDWFFLFDKREYPTTNSIIEELYETYEFNKLFSNKNSIKVVENKLISHFDRLVAVNPLNCLTLKCLFELGTYIDGSYMSIFNPEKLDIKLQRLKFHFQSQEDLSSLLNLGNDFDVNIINDIFYFDNPFSLISLNNKRLGEKFFNKYSEKENILGVIWFVVLSTYCPVRLFMNNFIQEVLGFYFGEGGFEQMIIEAELDQEEIEEWGNLAVLFYHCFGDVSGLTEKEKDDAYSLIESLYTKIEVDLMFGEIQKDAIDEICSGYDFDADSYRKEIEKGVALIESKGIDLYKLIGNGPWIIKLVNYQAFIRLIHETHPYGADVKILSWRIFGELDYQFGSIENNYLFTGEQYDNNVNTKEILRDRHFMKY